MKKQLTFISLGLVVAMFAGCSNASGGSNNLLGSRDVTEGIGSLLGGSSDSAPKLLTSYDNYAAYTKYLTSTTGDEDDLEVSTGDSGNTYVDNTSDYFVTTTLHISESQTSKDSVWSGETPLIRPDGYALTDDSDAAAYDYYHFEDTKFYEFDYDAPVNYDWMYDSDVNSGDVYYSIIYDGSYTQAEVEEIAKREYAIGALTDDMYNLYIFDENVVYDTDYPDYPDASSAVYCVKMDYSGKTISVMEGSDLAGTPVSTITME